MTLCQSTVCSFAKFALQLVTTEIDQKVGKVSQLTFDANSDADALRWHLKKLDDCKQILNGNEIEKLDKEGFKKKIVKS